MAQKPTVRITSDDRPKARLSPKAAPPEGTRLSTLAHHRSDPVVDRFVTTDEQLIAILERQPEPRSLIVQALLYIQECLEGKRLAKDVVSLAQAVPLKGWNPELLILFLSSWAELSCRIGRPSVAETLLHRARSIITEETHPEVVAAIMLVESNLADTTGNRSQSEKTLNEILKTVSRNSARRKMYVWEHALFMALQGRGQDVAEESKELTWQSNDRFRVSRFLIVQFIDAIETGQIQKASESMTLLKSSVHRPRDLTRFPFRDYQALLSLMHTELPDAARDAVADDHPRIGVIRSLLDNDPAEALRKARLEASRVLGTIFASGFESFNLIRAELSAGNPGSAQRLLQMRQSRGNAHYLDDLFMARVELIQKNTKKASHHFAEVLKAVDRYRAKGRLDFELRIACELDSGTIVRLTQDAERVRKRSLGVFTLRNKDGDAVSSNSLARQSAGKLEPETKSNPESPADEISKLGVNVFRGRSAAAEEIRQTIVRFADLDAPVLLTGETGTGKELVARALHVASSRRDQPFIVINCSAITESLLESELFGHEKGAFTGAEKANRGLFEATGKGTILLDEIGDISPRLQATLLRVLEAGEIRAVGSTETRKIDCRILAATNVNLEQAAQEGIFRTDLIYRLQRLCIHLPPLRERRDDILVLARHFLDTGRRIGVHAVLADAVRKALRGYDWPGNIRELHNVIERMRLMHSDKLSYDITDLDLRFQSVEQAKRDAAEQQSQDVERKERPKARPARDAIPARLRLGDNATRREEPTVDTSPAATGNDLAQNSPVPSTTDLDVERILDTGTSSMRRLVKLRATFAKHQRLTRKEVIQILDVSPNTATKYLQDLTDEGSIKVVSPNGSTRSRYFEYIGEAAAPPA